MKCRFLRVVISVTQSRDKAAMFEDKTRFIFAKFVWKKKFFSQRRETLLFLFTSMAPAWRQQSSVTNGHPILGDQGTDKGSDGKSKRAEKYVWNEEK